MFSCEIYGGQHSRKQGFGFSDSEFENSLKPHNNFTAAMIRLLGVVEKPEKNKTKGKVALGARDMTEWLT